MNKKIIVKHHYYECDCGLCSGDDEWVEIVADDEVVLNFYEVSEAIDVLKKLGLKEWVYERNGEQIDGLYE